MSTSVDIISLLFSHSGLTTSLNRRAKRTQLHALLARDLCFEYGSNADTERGMLYIVGLGCAAIVAGCVRST